MNKSGVFLIIFILLLGIAVVPTEPFYSATQNEPSSSVTTATLATTGTLRVSVAEDAAVANGSYADTNYGADSRLFLGTSYDPPWITGRSWFKFDLRHLPQELSVQRATMNVFIDDDYAPTAGADEPTGVYYCDDNSWELMAITWNNQPTFSSTPTSVIDSPASPNMFVPGNWYSWEVTPDVRNSLTGDKILSEVLKYTTELGTQHSFLYPMKSETYPFNATYLEIEYTTPTTSGLTVDGIASGPILDYINNPCPDMGWTFSDPDYQDFQKDYEVEIWNNSLYDDTLLWQKSHEYVNTIHDSNSVTTNSHPFGWANEFRMQMKYPSTEISRSGIVDKLYFTTATDSGETAILEDFEISMVLVPSSTDLTSDFAANYEGRTPTIVLSRDSYEISAINNIIEVDVEDTFFVYEGYNLIIEIRLMDNTGDLIRIDRTDSGGPGSVAYSYGDGYYESTTAINVFDRTYDLKIGYLTQSVYDDGVSTNGFPFGCTVGQPGRFQIKYNQSYIWREGYLDKMYFPVTSLSGEVTYENLTISIVETPVLGQIDHVDMESNYGGQTPVVVLDESMYTVRNLGYVLVIDFDNSYYYSNTHDLLIDFQWDSLVSGHELVRYTSGHTSSFRAWDLHWNSADRYDNGTAGYNLFLDFVNSEVSIPLDGCITLVNATDYYWRVRTCDSTGVWGDWATADFKYEVLSSLPTFSDPIAVPNPVEVNQEVTVSINATHSVGINQVLLELDGTNYSMSASVDTFSYMWTPIAIETLDYTIFIQSNANTWDSVSGSVNVTASSLPTGTPVDPIMLLIIIAGAAVVIVIIVIVMKKKK